MKNEADDRAQSIADELKDRLVNHLSDLQKFAQMPEDFRQDVLNEIRDQTMTEYRNNIFLFPTGLELFTRLSSIHKMPGQCEDVQTREPVEPCGKGRNPKEYVEAFLVDRFKYNNLQLTGNSIFIVAQSALFMTSGSQGRLDNRSVMFVQDADGQIGIIEFPFAIGEQVALKGYDAMMKGRHRSEQDFLTLKSFVADHFSKEVKEADDFSVELYNAENYLFYSFASVRDLTDALDEITFSDDIIEINED